MQTELYVKQTHQESIINRKNVNGVGVGVKWVNGKPTETPAILVFVQKKLAHSNVISKFSTDEMIPTEIDGIATDVIEVGQIKKQNLKSKIRPIKPGYSCGHSSISAGTIGGIFTDADGDCVILSNNHVLANENLGKVGDVIFQPGPIDANKTDFNGWDLPATQLPYFATLKRFVNINKQNNTQDSAIATVHDKFVKSGMIDILYPTINQPLRGFGEANINMQVQKVGRTTGYTTGRVIGLNASFTISYDFGPAKFDDCIVFSGMSKGGDSGSIITDMNMNAVSLLFAGSPKVTIGSPISAIVKEYGLRLWDNNASSMELDDGKWTITTSNGTINVKDDSIIITGHANNHCYFQRQLSNFNEITVDVDTGSDKGASWGPGVCIQWPTGILKVNLRNSGSFAGVINGNENLGIGRTAPNTKYTIRIRKTVSSYVGEVCDNGQWFKTIEVPLSVFPGEPLYLIVGKTSVIGNAGDHGTPGVIGTCQFSNLNVI